jgi:hypothetical protein
VDENLWRQWATEAFCVCVCVFVHEFCVCVFVHFESLCSRGRINLSPSRTHWLECALHKCFGWYQSSTRVMVAVVSSHTNPEQAKTELGVDYTAQQVRCKLDAYPVTPLCRATVGVVDKVVSRQALHRQRARHRQIDSIRDLQKACSGHARVLAVGPKRAVRHRGAHRVPVVVCCACERAVNKKQVLHFLCFTRRKTLADAYKNKSPQLCFFFKII